MRPPRIHDATDAISEADTGARYVVLVKHCRSHACRRLLLHSEAFLERQLHDCDPASLARHHRARRLITVRLHRTEVVAYRTGVTMLRKPTIGGGAGCKLPDQSASVELANESGAKRTLHSY